MRTNTFDLNIHNKSRFAFGCYYDISCILAQSIKVFRDELLERDNAGKTISYPCDFKDLEEWISVLDEMIDGFEKICNDEDYDGNNDVIDLFHKYFYSLWI